MAHSQGAFIGYMKNIPGIFLHALAVVLCVSGFTYGTTSHESASGKAGGKSVNWRHFRFDPKHTGNQSLEQTLSQQNVGAAGLLWQADLGGELVNLSSPAVVDGIVYIGESDGALSAYPAKGCGSDFCDVPLWRSTNLASIIDSPAVANGIVYVGSQTNFNDAHGKLNAFTAAGCGQSICAPLWQGKAGASGVQSSPVVWKGFVFVGSPDGKLFAFNADGCGLMLCSPVWTGKTGGGIESTPVVYQSTVMVGADDGKLYAFKAAGCGKATCKPRWTADIHGPAFESSPAVAEGVVYIASNHALSAFDATGCDGAKSCKPLWQAIDDNDFFGGSPAIANGLVYMPLESQLNVYDAAGCGHATCNPRFTLFGSGAQDGIESSPTIANGVVYAARNSGELLAWPAQCQQGSCDEIWKGFTDDPLLNSSPTVVDGKIYIGGSNHGFGGRLYVFGLQSQ